MGTSDLKHRLIAEVKEIASNLGHAPSRDEYRRHTKMGEQYRKTFGGFSPFLQAAGFKTSAWKQSAKEKAFFQADIGDVVKVADNIDPAEFVHSSKRKILLIGDTHFPFVHQPGLIAIYKFANENKDITDIVQLGDLFDCYSFASFPKSMMNFTPRQELDLARKMAGDMWSTLQAILPNAKCHQILGNHSVRPIKRLLEQSPELEVFFDYLKHWAFDGVRLYRDPRQPLVIGDVYIMHGYLTKLGDHARKHGVNVVCGHTHRGGVVAMKLSDGRTVYELNAGYLGDPATKALSYTATKLIEWTHGFGVIDQYGPRFISLGDSS